MTKSLRVGSSVDVAPPGVDITAEESGSSALVPRGGIFGIKLNAVLDDLREMLLSKNAAYGDSASNPVRCFSKADPAEAIRVRIDDKISRLMRGTDAGEDTTLDLIGYLILLRMVEVPHAEKF